MSMRNNTFFKNIIILIMHSYHQSMQRISNLFLLMIMVTFLTITKYELYLLEITYKQNNNMAIEINIKINMARKGDS